MKAKQKWIMIVGIIVPIAAAVGWHSLGLHDFSRNKWRRDWKTSAIGAIESKAADRAWLNKETANLKAKVEAHGEADGKWFSNDLLLMKNVDWIVYSAKCQKDDWRIRDIFIGRASDGKWYYTTFHFCRGMLDLRVEERSESLAKFIASYSLREFDGRSDECLNRTWPIPDL